jgi:hypothetical protein
VTPTIRLAALQVPVVISGLPDAEATVFEHLWRPCLHPAEGGDRVQIDVSRTDDGWRASTDQQVWDLAGDDAALAVASAAVNAVATTRTPLLAMHAAVLTRGGASVVVPGVSGAGKTTLSLALLQQGWSYTSDEALALDRGTATPRHYARPVAVTDWTRERLGLDGRGTRSAGETYLVAADIGADCDLEPGAPVLIVLRERADGSPSVSSVHRMEGLEALLRRGFTSHTDPAAALRLMADVVRGCDVARVRADDPVVAAQLITDLVG